jgi:Flp pilus assembly protein TadG
MKHFSKLKSDCLGNVSMMLAIAAVPLCLGVGAAVDIVRTNHTLTVLQGAVDAAVIAGAASGKTDDASLQAIVEDYLQQNGAQDILTTVDSIEPVLDKVGRTFSVRIKGKRNTALMHLAGIATMDLNVYAQTKLGGDGLEVAMVLDTTGSMNAAGRLPALKTAAADFVDTLMDAEAAGAYVRVGIVPFAEYVNVGMSVRNKPWMNVPADTSKTVNQCYDTYPDATSSNCHPETYTAYNDGVPYSATTTVCDWNYGAPKSVCNDVVQTEKWYGCVGSRNNPLDEDIGTASSPYPGLQNAYCSAEIEPLTKDKSALKSKISGLTANGNTYIPAGLLWGWNMVDENAPLEEAKSAAEVKDMGGTKAIVLMTDGDNTLSADYPWHWGTDGNAADKKVKEICKNIKKDNIVIYTVSFMVIDADTVKLLEHCASDSSKAFSADNATQLSQAFSDISAAMLALRLTK